MGAGGFCPAPTFLHLHVSDPEGWRICLPRRQTSYVNWFLAIVRLGSLNLTGRSG